MKHGDFTELAKFYGARPGYSERVLRILGSYIGCYKENFKFADVGAGTGKLTKNLLDIGLKGICVEPNDAMRGEGIKELKNYGSSVKWMSGSAESTNLEDSSVDWVFMASSFHWTDHKLALKEFHRILKPGGFFTALWNPRDIDNSIINKEVEDMIHKMVPSLKRVSSGSKRNMNDVEEKLLSTEYFDDLIFCEAPHVEIMDKERYLQAWRSVNDIQVQAGPEKFQMIMNEIEKIADKSDKIEIPYKTRAWTVRAK